MAKWNCKKIKIFLKSLELEKFWYKNTLNKKCNCYIFVLKKLKDLFYTKIELQENEREVKMLFVWLKYRDYKIITKFE